MASAQPHEIDPFKTPPSSRPWASLGLGRRDLALAALLMGLGAALRLAWFSGVGLADDAQWIAYLNTVDSTGSVPRDNVAYRFTWWLPTLAACRLFGFTETALIGPVLAAATLGIGIVYALGVVLAGRAGGLIAALLLIVLPLDFAWSTMMTNDVLVSFFCAVAMGCALLAAEDGDHRRKRWLWGAAAAALWLAMHAKLNAILMLPALALACWRRRDRLDEEALWFVIVGLTLLSGSLAASSRVLGDALAPYHAEMAAQGLTEPQIAIKFHRLTASDFWTWFRVLFRPSSLDTLLFSIDPHLLILAVVLARPLGLSLPVEIVAWLLVFLLGMQFNSLRQWEGVWVAGFRNVRHAHVFAYPIVLLLGVALAQMGRRRPRWLRAGMAALLSVGLWQSIATADKTRTAFADRRAVRRFLAGQAAGTVYSDFQLPASLSFVKALPFHPLDVDPQRRRREIAAITTGYLVTGGAREPVYGCVECIPRAAELPPGRWTLKLEVAGPAPSRWRPEPLRVWQAAEPVPQM
jgi:hypothetical protein